MIVKWFGQHNYSLTSNHLKSMGINEVTIIQGYIDIVKSEDGIEQLVSGVAVDFKEIPTEKQLRQIDIILPHCLREGKSARDLAAEIDELKTRIARLERK